jgi:hypothetical protein
MKAYGKVGVYIHIFLTSELVGGEWSASRPGCFTPEERASGTPWIGTYIKCHRNASSSEECLVFRSLNPTSSPSSCPVQCLLRPAMDIPKQPFHRFRDLPKLYPPSRWDFKIFFSNPLRAHTNQSCNFMEVTVPANNRDLSRVIHLPTNAKPLQESHSLRLSLTHNLHNKTKVCHY